MQDFELICTNAMRYNQKRSRIHKAARTILRAGMKQLQGAEAQGRAAVMALHPDGVDAALKDEADHPAPEPAKQRRGSVGTSNGTRKTAPAPLEADSKLLTAMPATLHLPNGIKMATPGTSPAQAATRSDAPCESSQAAVDFDPMVGPNFGRGNRDRVEWAGVLM